MSASAMVATAQSTIDTRRHQMFPILEPADIERIRRFGKDCSYHAGEALVEVGHGGLEGRDGVLQAIRWRQKSAEEVRTPIQHLFLFIGAEPNTDWLSGSGIAVDAKGFVLTGGDCNESRNLLETSRRGIFAIGDVRSGSIKRVAAAVGEDAQVVAALHSFLD
jgi:thioredoxin reductase (NADPH)